MQYAVIVVMIICATACLGSVVLIIGQHFNIPKSQKPQLWWFGEGSIEIDDPSGVFGNRDYGKTTVTKVKL